MPENIKKGTFINLIAYTLSGLFLLFFNILAARGLGTEQFGIISVLWTSIMVVSRFLTTGIKDGSTRFISHQEAINDQKGMTKVFLTNLKFIVWVTVFFLLISLIFFKILTFNLFSGYFILYLFFLLSSTFYFLLFFLRGTLQGLRELKDNAISIIIEYSTLLIFLLILFYFLKTDIFLAGLCILLAPISSLFFIAFITSKHRKRFSQKSASLPDTKTLMLFVIPTSFINFSSGFIVLLGPILIKFLGDFALAGIFTASLMIFKGAKTALTALFISIFPHLSRQEALKNYQMLNRIIRNGLIFISVVFIALIIAALTFGQTLLRLLFGNEFVLGKIHLFLMSLFTGFFLLSELFNRILLAKSMIKELIISWVIAFGCLIILLLLPLEPLIRVEISLLGAGISAFIGMSLFLFCKKKTDE
ncbi:oligosaccharide flippase family protein [candidate division WOR-3 bacterium]|nr:oligosaccharide flippase family protein [candidate division WOR-3 bacterium]